MTREKFVAFSEGTKCFVSTREFGGGGGGRSREISAILARDRVVWVRLNWGKKIEI